MSETVYSSKHQGRLWGIVPDLIAHRGLLADLVLKELRARYRNAMMGLLWAVLQPLLLTAILTFVFTVVFRAGGRAGVAQSALGILCKLVFWQFLSVSLFSATESFIVNQDLLKKIHFARETLPLAAVGNSLVNFVIGFATFLFVHALLAGAPSRGIVWLPLFLSIEGVAVIGLALGCAAVNVYYRDIGYILQVLLTFGFYASPILYPLEAVEHALGPSSILFDVYCLNPMVGLLTACEKALISGQVPQPAWVLWPLVAALLCLVLGVAVFRRMAPALVDYL